MKLAVILGLLLLVALSNAAVADQTTPLADLTYQEFGAKIYVKAKAVFPKMVECLAKKGEAQNLTQKFQTARGAMREFIWALLLTMDNAETS
ncbi:unnamed protein product [Echinostoma caproni]|uniref:Secreted protein n=1 Tax=Echinostoma caproni TaxID=27848 RepID=A0A183AW02_9TREM|nr:unnamed protein product [Echinostoma caproni]